MLTQRRFMSSVHFPLFLFFFSSSSFFYYTNQGSRSFLRHAPTLSLTPRFFYAWRPSSIYTSHLSNHFPSMPFTSPSISLSSRLLINILASIKPWFCLWICSHKHSVVLWYIGTNDLWEIVKHHQHKMTENGLTPLASTAVVQNV